MEKMEYRKSICNMNNPIHKSVIKLFLSAWNAVFNGVLLTMVWKRWYTKKKGEMMFPARENTM